MVTLRPISRRCSELGLKGESRTKRRAVSAVLSGLLLFSMLFTVGTGYFMFVINGESQYTHTLANRAAGLQSQLAESLTITPASGASNHLVFTATNIGGAAANITDVFVVYPSGVTHTYGLGFAPANTTPALPGGVTPQKTSASYDTGITIVPGVYTMKVITHRGNAYTATYPPPPSTSFASATGSLTVDLSSFRWVQLTGTSSITQENYAPNCNAALCGAGFSSNIASGDTIVYAVGWANHAAPATPTDTRGDTFTLGASNTVSASSINPPTLVQKNYNSNCASSSCGLGFTSNVAAGNTLVFGLGWSTVTQYYVPITLTNGQGSATPTTFQQSITWNPSTYSAYESSTLSNIRFCSDTACVTTLNAWLESCTTSCTTTATSATAWVKLTSAIPASGGTKTIYMVFQAATVGFDGNYWGEAPNLSVTYGLYDNGANVFTAYFNGNTATSSFSVSSGYTLAKSTGVTYGTGTISALHLTGYNGNNVPLVFNAQMSNAAMIGESNFEQNHLATDQGTSGFANNAAVASVLNAIGVNMGWSNEYFNQDYMSGGTVSNNWNGQGTDATVWLYSSTTYLGSSATTYTGYIAPQLYSSSGGYSGTVSVNPISSATNLYLG